MLTIESGVVVKAADGVVVSVGDEGAGTLKAIGTAGRPIVFTTSGSLSCRLPRNPGAVILRSSVA